MLKLTGTVETGLPMLGCWIAFEAGQLTVWPTEKNLDRLNDTVDELFHKAAMSFEAADEMECEMLRLQAIQEYLRLRNFCHAWLNAYAFCDLDPCIEEHPLMHIGELEALYKITDAEVKAATDASVIRVEGNKQLRILLHLTPDDPEFIEHYRAARAGFSSPAPKRLADTAIPHSLAWLTYRFEAAMHEKVNASLMRKHPA